MFMLWLFAGLFAVYSLAVTIRSNFTAGTLFLWGITAALFLYAAFHRPIREFCKSGMGRLLKYGFWAGCFAFFALLVFVAVSGYTGQAKGDEKAIIVLGAGLNGEEVSSVLECRLQAALTEWENTPEAVLVVTGGQGKQEVIPEAVAMQRWLAARGVPPDKIILEDRSTNTEENLAFAQDLLRQAGILPGEPVAVVSNAFHCYRAGYYARLAGFTSVSTVPANMNPFYALPSYMREAAAIVYMWLFK